MGGGWVNIVVHYVIQCGDDDIYVRFFHFVSSPSARESVKVLFLLTHHHFAQKWNAFFIFAP